MKIEAIDKIQGELNALVNDLTDALIGTPKFSETAESVWEISLLLESLKDEIETETRAAYVSGYADGIKDGNEKQILKEPENQCVKVGIRGGSEFV